MTTERVCPTCRSANVKVKKVTMTLPGTAITVTGNERVTCSACGEDAETWVRMGEQFELAARALLAKPRRLAGGEVVFLRKLIGWKAGELAARLGVTPGSVSRWENGGVPILPPADRALRAFVAIDRHVPLNIEELGALEDGNEPLELGLELSVLGWGVAPERPAKVKRKAS